MLKEIYFRDFGGMVHHYQFIEDQLERALGNFEGFRPISVKVNIEEVKAKKSFRGHTFGCEIIAQHPDMKNSIVVHKYSKDFYQCVRQTCKAVERIFGRYSKVRTSQRRKGFEQVTQYVSSSPQQDFI